MLNVMHSGRRVVAALAYNTNFAGEFPVLDALFGTLYRPADRWPAQYGIDDSEPAGYPTGVAIPRPVRGRGPGGAPRLG